MMASAGEAVENFTGLGIVDEEFFFSAKFGRMGDKAAAGATRGMFDVEHFVVEDVFDGDLRDRGMIHAAVEQNLVGARIVATKLAAPAARAPADVRALQISQEIFFVQLPEHFFEIEVAALRACGSQANAAAAHLADAAARAIRARIVQVRRDQRARRFSAKDARQEQCGSAFQNRQRGAAQQIRKTNKDNFFAATNREREAGVGIELDAKARGTTVAAEAGEDALTQRGATGDWRTCTAGRLAVRLRSGLF